MNDIYNVSLARAYIRSTHEGLRFASDVLSQARRIATSCTRGLHVLESTVVEVHNAGGRQPLLNQLLMELSSSASSVERLIVCSKEKLASDPARLAEVELALQAAGVTLEVVRDSAGAEGAPMSVEPI